MATQKPISTISYNSESFLVEKLNELYKAHKIQAWHYIKHKGEDGDKDHIHLRIEPNTRLDPMDLVPFFREPVPMMRPLGVRPFRPSKEEDWFLYVVHDKDYLNQKYYGGEKCEKFPYTWEDIVASPDYDVEVAYIRAKAALSHSSVSLARRIQGGTNPLDLVLEGCNVNLVNGIVRSLSDNDYLVMASNLQDCQEKISLLVQTLEKSGILAVFDDKNKKWEIDFDLIDIPF